MVAVRLTLAVIVGCLATSAAAGERTSGFSVSVRVTSPLRKPAPATAPASFAIRPGVETLACAPASCAAAASRLAPPGAPVVVTTFLDGAPLAVVER